jgi:uncharacterized RDD family membrane protein YckC
VNARHVAFLLIVTLVTAWPAGSSAQESKFLLTGNEKAIWLARQTVGKGFDAAVKPTGEAWRWSIKDRPGAGPAAICASEDRLYMLFPLGDYWNVGLDGQEIPELKAGGPRWPEDSQGVLLVEAVDFAGLEGTTTLAVVPRPHEPTPTQPKSRPATATAPAGSQVTIGVFQYTRIEWTHLTDLDVPVPMVRAGDVRAAFANSALYLYVPGSDALRKLQWRGKPEWKVDVPFSDQMSHLLKDSPVLALLAVEGQPTLVLAGPIEDQRRGVSLAIFDGSQWRLQQVMEGAGPAAWPTDGLPLVSRFAANQIAFITPHDKRLKFATCDLSGRLTSRDEVDIFEKLPTDSRQAQEILEYFMWGLLVAAVAPLFMFRSKAERGPFVMPQRRLPANLLKRLLAAILDLLPGSIIALAVIRPPMPAQPLQDVQQIGKFLQSYTLSVEGVYVTIVSSVLYVVYCTVMEMRFGATAGKMLLRLRVVNRMDQRPNLREAFMRNLFKIVEMSLPLGVPLLLLFPLFNRNRQRLGDMLAGTAVVEAARLAPLPQETPPPPPGADQGQ